MKAVWSWLLELVDLDRAPTVEEGARALTAVGLEIEALTDLGAGFRGVVVAEVVARRPHPQAEKLSLVDVLDTKGGTVTQVVCGASNVPAPGRKVLWAQPGAVLPGGFTIAPKAIKGITSPGMLCSEVELGIGDDDSGIVVLDADDPTALGAAAQKALGVDDWVLEVNVPANRGDVLGHLGLARELAAVLGGRLVPPAPGLEDLTDASLDAGKLARVDIADPAGCARYVARVIDGVTVRPSPRRFAQRLRAVGVRPVSNLVDVTNYVMFELGQPLHAFDAARVAGSRIAVRRAAAGEKLTTLDGVERTLTAGDLLICDAERAVALAGVMGGLDSEVTADTTRVLLEAASFDALGVRRTARRLGLHSEASHRFERGVDPEIADLASARAAALLARLGGGRVARGVVDTYPRKRSVAAIPLRIPRAAQVTGIELDAAACRGALERLGFAVAKGKADTLSVTPPSPRADVTREVDLIEEIVRLVGYDRVPTTLPALREAPRATVDERPDRARQALAAAGLYEAITFGFTSRERVAALRLPADDVRNRPIALRNPMSVEQAVMRTSLLPNLLGAIARNRSFGLEDVALFEVGSVFLRTSGGDGEPTGLADEPTHVCAVLSGHRPGWLGGGGAWDFYDARGFVDALVEAVTGDERAVSIVPGTDEPFLHPGISARLVARSGDGEPVTVGWIGEVHLDTRTALGVDAPVLAFGLELGRLPARTHAQMRAIPRFPASSRDVSLLLAEATPAARVREVIDAAAQPLVETVRVVEEYRGANLPSGHRSMLWSITYRSPDRTLTDAEVDAAHEAIVSRLLAELPAQRR
jgi:phenylalanyl-tRNA synthetase beta chain